MWIRSKKRNCYFQLKTKPRYKIEKQIEAHRDINNDDISQQVSRMVLWDSDSLPLCSLLQSFQHLRLLSFMLLLFFFPSFFYFCWEVPFMFHVLSLSLPWQKELSIVNWTLLVGYYCKMCRFLIVDESTVPLFILFLDVVNELCKILCFFNLVFKYFFMM